MTLTEMQGYAFFFFTILLVVILYGYILHLYRSEKKGERDYEKYGKMALEDELHDRPVEANPKATNDTKEK
ncbi:cytochrome c oxidase, cbb3-type, CcoQ subunit [Nitratifractor sp.]